MLQPVGSLNRSLFDTIDRNYYGVITWDELEQALGSQSRASSGRKHNQHEFRPSTHRHTRTRTSSTHRHTRTRSFNTQTHEHSPSKDRLEDAPPGHMSSRTHNTRVTSPHTHNTTPTHPSLFCRNHSQEFRTLPTEPETWRTFLGAVSLQSLLTSPRFMNSLPLSFCLCVGLGDAGLRTSAPRCLHVARDHLQGCNLGSLLRGARRCHLCQNALLWEAVPCRRSSRKSLCSAIRQR